MNQYLKLACVTLLASALAACSGLGSSMPNPNNPVHAATVTRGVGDLSNAHVMLPSTVQHFVQPNITLAYHGGPVLKKPFLYVVYWGFTGSGDPNNEQAYLTNFLNGVGGSAWLNTDHQYYQIVNGLNQHIANQASQLLGTWVDTTNAVPTSPSDSQIRAEAANLEAHFGFNKGASYVVATPHGHNTPGFGSQFCAYHGAAAAGGHTISYTNLPYMTDAGRNCGENFVNPGSGGTLDGVSIVEGHEYAESQTDPQLNAWFASNGEETGDICAWVGLGDITLSTGTFAVQPLFSNKKGGCVLHTP